MVTVINSLEITVDVLTLKDLRVLFPYFLTSHCTEWNFDWSYCYTKIVFCHVPSGNFTLISSVLTCTAVLCVVDSLPSFPYLSLSLSE